MGRIISLLSGLDAAVQRRFDSVCFFLMSRLGIRKSTMKFGAWAVSIIGLAAGVVDLTRHGHAAIAAILGFMMFVHLLVQHLEFRLETAAEAAGKEYPETVLAKKAGRMKFQCLLILIAVSWLIPQIPEYRLLLTGTQVKTIGTLVLLYLAKTPMNPPAEREQESALTPEPVRARS